METNSDTVFALLLSPDGTIRERNRAAQRIFPANLAESTVPKLWDYLVLSDSEHLRRKLSESESANDASFLLNLAEGDQSPVTWEARLLRCDGYFLLLATEERRRDALFQNEILRITNDLSIAVREFAQKNRELKNANETIEKLARIDGLTGLANRRILEETLPREAARANRLNESLSVIFVDVDHFKPINDEFGHDAGDQVLAQLGNIFKSQLRSYDLAARFGGDEFVLLLPGTTRDGAIVIAERIRAGVGTLAFPEYPRQVTVSIGIAALGIGETGEELVAHADEALYRAKGKGGNRFEVA
jgi:diguanylate cyclase (GGDEF)-like protein